MLELANMWTIFMTFVLYGIFSKRSWWQWGQFSKVLLLKIRVSMKSHCNCFISINIGAKIMSNCIKDILFLIKCDKFTSLDEVCKAFLLVCVVKSKNHVQGKCKNGQKRHHQDNYRGNHWSEIDNKTMGFSLILDIEGMVNSTLSTSVDSKYFINSIVQKFWHQTLTLLSIKTLSNIFLILNLYITNTKKYYILQLWW